MLDEKKIKEVEKCVRAYLDEGLLKKVENVDERIIKVFEKNAEESLKIAEQLFESNSSSLWTIVCSYYSMFYIANAVLYFLGYKVGHKIAHKVTNEAMTVFVRKYLQDSFLEDFEEAREEALELAGIRADELIEDFGSERVKRTKFQYETTESAMRNKAQTSLERAKRFVFEMRKLLEK